MDIMTFLPGLGLYLALLLATAPFVITWLITSYQFRRDIVRLRQNHKLQKNGQSQAPVIPYYVPVLGDVIGMFSNPHKYISGIL